MDGGEHLPLMTMTFTFLSGIRMGLHKTPDTSLGREGEESEETGFPL
jgi:hypothetical protein